MILSDALTIGAVMATNLITIITLYIHLDNKTKQSTDKTDQLILAIHQEMKDFHGRLCAIEERRK